MPETTTTLGQLAYAAYRQERVRLIFLPTWHELTPDHHHAWEAAAQAAIAQWWRAHEAVICGNDNEERADGG